MGPWPPSHRDVCGELQRPALAPARRCWCGRLHTDSIPAGTWVLIVVGKGFKRCDVAVPKPLVLELKAKLHTGQREQSGGMTLSLPCWWSAALDVVLENAGHTSLTTTSVYVHPGNARLVREGHRDLVWVDAPAAGTHSSTVCLHRSERKHVTLFNLRTAVRRDCRAIPATELI